MTRPDPRQQAALSAAFSGAIDLSALKRPPAGAGSPPTAAPASQSPYVVTVTEAEFGEVVQASTEVPIVFDLWSPRSQGSQQLSPVLIGLAERGNGAWILARVDVDANPRVAQAFGVQAIPTVVAVAGGQPVDAFTGVQTDAQVRTWISTLLDALRDKLPGIRAAEQAAGGPVEPEPEPEDPRFTAAEELLEAGDFGAAAAAYQAILAVEPANADAAAALAQVNFFARLATHPPDVLEQAAAAPDDVPLQAAAADLEIADGDVDAAFRRLIATVARTSGDDRTAAREHLVGLFGLYPVDDERVRIARRALAAALY